MCAHAMISCMHVFHTQACIRLITSHQTQHAAYIELSCWRDQERVRDNARRRMQQLMTQIEANSQEGTSGSPGTSHSLTKQLEAAVQGLGYGLVERDTEVRPYCMLHAATMQMPGPCQAQTCSWPSSSLDTGSHHAPSCLNLEQACADQGYVPSSRFDLTACAGAADAAGCAGGGAHPVHRAPWHSQERAGQAPGPPQQGPLF